MGHLTRFEETLLAIDKICKNNSLPYALIGGLAGVVHKIPRVTQDIDITLLTDLQDIHKTGEILLKTFMPLKESPLDFFEKYFVLPVYYEPTKIRIDFSAGLGGFDRLVVKRSKRVTFGKVETSVCSVEDLIIYKLVAGRLRDLADVEELFRIHHKTIDIQYLKKIASSFIELERADIPERIEEFLSRFHLSGDEHFTN
jgi:hypothetical protein